MQKKLMQKFLNLFYSLILILITILLFSNQSFANIYGIDCSNKKGSTKWVYSSKRKAIVLYEQDSKKTKVKFEIKKETPSFLEAKGTLNDFKTTVTFDIGKKEVTVLQSAIQGKNYFMQCSEPKVLKQE